LLGKDGTPIAKDEPVFLVRAQDKYIVPLLNAYLEILEYDEENLSDDAFEKAQIAISKHIDLIRAWQAEHPPKTPDAP
jgi:hypothetical protein